jgi:hypothetical protein
MPPALDNARAALQQLQSFLSTPVLDDRDRAGVIQAFEFTFETVWKLFKHIAEAEGLEAPSPKRALMQLASWTWSKTNCFGWICFATAI